MVPLLFRQWWIVLLQGIVLILLAFYIFSNPVTALAGVSLWFGISVFITGVLGVLAWFGADKSERDGLSLLWNVLTTVFGLFMLMNLFATMGAIAVIFGLWMLFTGLHIAQLGWTQRKNHTYGWVIFLGGLLAALIALPMIFNIGLGAVGVSTLLGTLVLLAGLALILFSLIKKKVGGKIQEKIENVRSALRQ